MDSSNTSDIYNSMEVLFGIIISGGSGGSSGGNWWWLLIGGSNGRSLTRRLRINNINTCNLFPVR